MRENIINYADEGGGEDDMNAFDITPLRIPIDSSNLMNKQTMIKDLRQRQCKFLFILKFLKLKFNFNDTKKLIIFNFFSPTR